VIRLDTDEGVAGWGETFRGSPTTALIDRLRETVIGWNPYQLEKLRGRLHMTPFFHGYIGYAALGGIEMACFDLIGKAAGRPVADLIGGAMRDRVPVTGVVTTALVGDASGQPSASALADAAAAFRDRHGFTTLKLKGSTDADTDVRRCEALRARMPDVVLRLDPNAAWSVQDSIRAARRLLPLDLEYLEDPCAGIEGMARVRQTVPIPLCTNMCVVRLEEFAPAVRLGAVDVIHGDVFKWGGILPNKRLAALCDGFGIGMNLHSGGELGLATACHLHLAASTPEIRYAIDTVYDLMADDIVVAPPRIEGGAMAVPTAPGLGVEIDLDKLAHYARAHAVDGDLLK
jgi:glucarate dehydratase